MSTNRSTTGYIAKKAESKSGLPLFVLSDETKDRSGDIVRVNGWDLQAFRKNPVALWQHDSHQPIGSWKNVRVEGTQLLGELKLSSIPLGQMAQTLIDEGVLRAVSVGFRVKEYEPIDAKEPWGAWEIKAAELFETSLVSVPANPSALLVAKRLGLSLEQKKLIFADLGQSQGQHPSQPTSGPNLSIQRALELREEIRALLGKQVS